MLNVDQKLTAGQCGFLVRTILHESISETHSAIKICFKKMQVTCAILVDAYDTVGYKKQIFKFFESYVEKVSMAKFVSCKLIICRI